MATDTSSRAVLHPWERIKRSKKLQQIFGSDRIDEESPVVHKRPTKRKLFPQSSLCGYRAMRAARLTAIRESMNRLMNISADAEIHKVDCITEEEADDFEEGQAVGPELNPMHPYLDTSKHTRWNNELAKLFVEHLQEEEEGVTFTQKDKEMVEEMFLARLGRLSRTWREYWTLSPEGREKKRQRMRGLAQRNTRRLYNNRLAVCYGNVKNRNGTTNPGWKATTEMVEQLGPAGMSSDESEVDAMTKKVTYRICKRLWRSSACKDRLLMIDADRNVTNALGGARAGNPAREQVRGSNATVSKRTPTVGCPENYYLRVWVSNLGSR
ncbi:hypothetical protein BYT27DRAFT_7114412 [Phlegmacium glaucopus]|nr:hypothetical protein BYT27DRAFT_7114412 [Phlegmacium glaucopus]